jgi:hypothetical protein
MKKSTIITSIACLTGVAIMCISAGVRYSNGSATQYTDSPVDGPGDCSGCHRGGSSTPTLKITPTPAWGAGNTYQAGKVYTIAVNVTGYPDFGFDLEIVNNQTTTAKDAGSAFTASSLCRVTAATSTVPTNITHTGRIPSASSATFKWTAPASGPAYIYCVGLGVNADGGTSGDLMATPYELTLNASPLGVKETETANVNLNVFPNPASSDIHLRYTLEKQSQVSIKIYDLTGKIAADLLNETLPAGEQTFDSYVPSNLSKGIYTLNLTVDGTPVIKKLVIR